MVALGWVGLSDCEKLVGSYAKIWL